jgi:hypothetical protein
MALFKKARSLLPNNKKITEWTRCFFPCLSWSFSQFVIRVPLAAESQKVLRNHVDSVANYGANELESQDQEVWKSKEEGTKNISL